MSVLEARSYLVGDGTEVRRLLPQRVLRTVGAWCFADHYGPDDVSHSEGMQVPPHPHTGLQTVSWLLDGEIVHRDSLGSLQRVAPGELSLMTSGDGIAHSEESPQLDRPPLLGGVQLWVALPESARHGEAGYEHHTELPVVEHGALRATVVLGEHAGVTSRDEPRYDVQPACLPRRAGRRRRADPSRGGLRARGVRARGDGGRRRRGARGREAPRPR
jgi:quercetin 2,3-dioxygenase